MKTLLVLSLCFVVAVTVCVSCAEPNPPKVLRIISMGQVIAEYDYVDGPVQGNIDMRPATHWIFFTKQGRITVPVSAQWVLAPKAR